MALREGPGLYLNGTNWFSPCMLKIECLQSHHYLAIFIGWFLGNAMLFLWNAILNAGDYFYSVFPVSFRSTTARYRTVVAIGISLRAHMHLQLIVYLKRYWLNEATSSKMN